MARRKRFELLTFGSVDQRSVPERNEETRKTGKHDELAVYS